MTKLLGTAAATIAALSLAAAPAMAQNQASALSLRASTAAKKGSDLAGPPAVAVIGLLAIVGGAIYIAVDEDSPDSP